MEIRASNKSNYEAIKALIHVSLYKRANPKKCFLIWTVLAVILIAIIIVDAILHPGNLAAGLLLFVTGFYLFLFYLHFRLPKSKYKAMSNMKDVENVYIFYDDDVKVFTKTDAYHGEAELKYTLMPKVYETSRFFFLFQTEQNVFVVDKNTIEGGAAEEIRRKLMSYLKSKYIICKY